MTRQNPFSHLGGPPVPTREMLAAEAKSHALADALASDRLEHEETARQLAEAQAQLRQSQREAKTLQRQLDAAEDRESEARSNEIVAETLAGLRAARASVPSYDEVFETLQGSPSAQKLARMIVAAAAKAHAKQSGAFIFNADDSAEGGAASRSLAARIINAGRKARGLPPLAESDETAPGTKSPKPRKLPEQVDVDDDENAEWEVGDDGELRRKKKPVADDETDEAETPNALVDPDAFAQAVIRAAAKARGR
jgi:DNA-binding protein H-NS